MRSIKEWPEDERPREKLLRKGAETLSDAELLALILRTGDSASHTSAVDQARNLLGRFGSLRSLAGASSTELQQQKGIGPAKTAELLGVLSWLGVFLQPLCGPVSATAALVKSISTTMNGSGIEKRKFS